MGGGVREKMMIDDSDMWEWGAKDDDFPHTKSNSLLTMSNTLKMGEVRGYTF